MNERQTLTVAGALLRASILSAAVAGCTGNGSVREKSPPRSAAIAAPHAEFAEHAQDVKALSGVTASPVPIHESLRSVTTGTGVFINRDPSEHHAVTVPDSREVTFNFEGESLHAVVKTILGDFLQQNFTIAPGVQGTVTFSTAKPLRGDQALSILEMLLRWNNATLVWQDDRYTILPVAQALPGNLTPRSGPAANARGYEVRAVPLQFISALEMEKLIKPYAKPEGIVNVDAARNMIVLAGTRVELENYMQTINVFDVDWLSGMSVGVYPLQQAEAAKTVTELEKIFGAASNTPMAGMFRFMPLGGVNAVMVITPQPKYLEQIEEWLTRLDLGGGEAGERLYVYDVQNVKASDLAATLSDIFGGGSSSGAAGTPHPSGDSLMPGLEPVEIRTVGSSGNLSPSSGAEKQSEVGGLGNNAPIDGYERVDANGSATMDESGGITLGANDDVRVTAVEESNALLVKATPGQWESIRRVIKRLDTIPLQVHIEAQIVRVLLNDSLNYGVSWFFENGITGAPGGDAILPLARGQGGFGDHAGTTGATGVNWSFIGPDAYAILTALDSVTKTTVLATPSLVVLNNKSATIDSGLQIPVVSSFVNSGGDGGAGNPNQSYVQFRQTGITLSVTPRVNPGGLVFMEVSQESSEATGEGQNPTVDNRSIETEVAVQDGQTLVLGGLIKTSNELAKAGLPGLSRLPVLGGFFGKRSSIQERSELIVLITPHVIRDETASRRLTDEYSRRFQGMDPLRAEIER